ncbi:hypothetical protein ACWEKR_33335 [Nocardia sp. NPDC004573]
MPTPTSTPRPDISGGGRGPSTLTTEDFDAYMDAMHAHYLVRARGLRNGHRLPEQARAKFQLPDGLADHPHQLEVSQDVKDIIRKYNQDPNLSAMDDDSAYVESKTAKAKDGEIDQDEFDRLMDERANKNIEDFTKTQNVTKEKLKDYGHAHPDEQTAILDIFNEVSDFLLGPQAWMKIINFITNTVKDFLYWAGKVLGWFGNVVSAVVNFFERLLG